jgi:putative GTP pyrophosphokinase
MPTDLTKLETEYNGLRSIADSFCTELTSQVSRLVEDEGIALGFPIQHRVKRWGSLSEKLERMSFKGSSIREIQDLIGLRLVLLFQRDIDKVGQQLEKNLTVIRKYNTQERLQDNQFGYSSIHFIVEVPTEWLSVPTLARFKGLQAEIQLRTVAQHIWAEVSHTLQYKQKESVPPSVARSIYRVSALLETVDLEFERVLAEREAYRTEVNVSETEDLLNVDLLAKTLDGLFPPRNKTGDEDYSALLTDLSYFGIRRTVDLTSLINKHYASIMEFDRAYSHQVNDEDDDGQADPALGDWYFNHAGLARQALDQEFGAPWSEYQKEKFKAADLGLKLIPNPLILNRSN